VWAKGRDGDAYVISNWVGRMASNDIKHMCKSCRKLDTSGSCHQHTDTVPKI